MTAPDPLEFSAAETVRRTGPPAAGQSAPRQAVARKPEPARLPPAILEQRRLIHEGMHSRQVDLVRELRTNVFLRSGTRNPVVMVTGVSHGCGTSFMARNLAASIAFDEERTALLIECDHHHPTLASDFRLPGEAPGLLDMLNGAAEDLSKVIYPSGVERLRFIPLGRASGSGREHFASMRMRGLLNEIRQRYDDRHVVIDAPPVLGSPDARILAQYADLIILVVGEGKHRAAVIRRAAEMLPSERLAGVAFNHLP